MGAGPSIVRVCVDSPLPHLDRLFDYSVPPKLTDTVKVGTRVRIPFHGRLVGGIVCEIGSEGTFEGRLSEIRSAGLMPSTTEAGIALARRVASRYGGSLWDVLRLAIPPRVASVEKRWAFAEPPRDGAWSRSIPAARTEEGGGPMGGDARLVWEAIPDSDRSSLPLDAVLAPVLDAAEGDGSAILIVPDARAIAAAVARLEKDGLARWTTRSGGEVAVIHTEDGPTARYENYLAGLTGSARIVVGTRPTAFQPVPRPALISMWADGNSAYHDPHAPYPHARVVAAIRAETEGTRLLLGGWAPSLEAAALVEHGWAAWGVADRASVREAVPAVDVLTGPRREEEGPGGWHWMPGTAWRVVRDGLDRGPVFVLVPRAGYVTALACARCGGWSVCLNCDGPLGREGEGCPPTCRDCGKENLDWHCPDCHGRRLAEVRQGIEKVAGELKRMAPSTRIHVSSADSGILDDGEVADGIVVATPGALPAVSGGYAAGVIVGADSGLGRVGTEVDSARLWFGAAALVRSRKAGGRVIVVGDLEPAARRALETWTPGDLARGAARERANLGLPPFRRVIQFEGPPSLLDEARGKEIGGTPLIRRPDVDEVPSDGALVLLAGRGVAQEVVVALRGLVKEASATGVKARLRVDGPFEIEG